MKKLLVLLSVVLFASTQVYSHSGRTDKKGGHNCSEKSKKKGLCTGYHYHNQGSSSTVHSHELETTAQDTTAESKAEHTHSH